MQKFKGKFQNSPTDAPQVCSSESTSLNRDSGVSQGLSEAGKVRTLNNLEVDPLQHKGGPDSRVPVTAYVLNMRGNPLMPCSARKARILIKKGEAKVVRTNPFFVIQLLKATGENVQACSLGIDSGYKFVGFSVITDRKEIVSGELELDQRTAERMTDRAMFRRIRRKRLWHRPPRFNNRKVTKGFLPPSIQRKLNTHITLINLLKQLLPVKNLSVEISNFDIQKIENPDIEGIQYSRGSLYGYENMRSFLMAREHGKCQICGKGFNKEKGSHIHHIIPRSQGGTDREKNLSLLHKKCHEKLHKKNLGHLLKQNKDYKASSFMSILQYRFRNIFSADHIIFGAETFVQRNALRLEKTHYNDAFVIAGGATQTKIEPILLKQKHINNRVLQCSRKGGKPQIRRKRYSIQPHDIIIINRKNYCSTGCSHYGRYVMYFNGIKNVNLHANKITKVFHVGSIYRK